MAEGDRVGSAHVDIHVNAAPGEAELAAFRQKVDRDFAELGRKKAEAEFKIKSADFDKKYADAKKKLDYVKMRRSIATLDLAKKHFDKEIAAATAELKAIGDQRTEIQVDVKQVRAAHAAERLLTKERTLSEQAALKQTRAEQKNSEELRKAQFEVDKLRAAYNKLGNERRRLETKAGRPGGIFHTEAERLELRKLRSEMELTEHRIRSLDGDVNDIDIDFEDNRSILLRWGSALANTRLHMGFFSATIQQTMIGLVVLGPVLTGLAGAATSLIGVLGTGLTGASAVAAAGLGGLALSAIGATAVIKPIIGDLEEAVSASDAYHKAVLKYGKGSDKAAEYQEKLSSVLKEISPGAREAIEELSGVKEEFREASQAARPAVFEAFASTIKTVHALLPSFARESVKTTTVLSENWQQLMENLRSDDAKQGIETIMRNFRIGLPPLLNGFEILGRIFGHISVSASKFLPGLNHGFAEWAENLERSVGEGAQLDSKIARLINHMRDLGHFSQASARLLIALFNTSADSGDGLLETLTRIFNRWADWMNSVEGQRSLRDFFSDAASETENLFAVLGKLIHLIWAMGRAFAPVADGALEALNTVGAMVELAAEFDPLLAVLREIGKLIAAVWAVNKVRAFTTAVAAASRALTGFAVVSGGASAAGTLGAGAAGTTARRGEKVVAAGGGAIAGAAAAEGAAAGRGLVGGISKAAKIAGPAAMLLTGIELAESVADGFKDRAKQRSNDIFEALEGAESTPGILGGIPIGKDSLLAKIIPDGEAEAAKNVKTQLEQIGDERTRISAQTEKSLRLQLQELDINEDAKRSAQEMFALTRIGRKLDIKVSGANDPAQLQKLLHGYSLLRSGALAALGDIGKITRQNAAIIRTELPRGSEEARRKLGENFRSAAAAVKQGMEDGTINVKRGTEQWKQLLRNARLLEGRDPLGLAKGFAASWKEAGGINKRNRERMIDELGKMPPRAREKAFQAMMQYGRGLVRGKKIPEEDLRKFKSEALVELEGIGRGFQNLSGTAFIALQNIGVNLSEMLRNIGGKPPKFNLQKALNSMPELPVVPNQKGTGQQQGGFTVPGFGSGDKIHRILPEGSFVMNREASSAYGLNEGGPVHTVLEPKEHVFLPKEVQRIGAGRLDAMNKAVPRQQGGLVGKGGGFGPEPQIIGPNGALLEVGQGAIGKAYEAAKEFYDKQAARLAGPGGPLGSAPGELGTIERLASQFNLSVTSAYRPGDDGWHGKNRARDFSNGYATPQELAFGQAVAARWGSRLLELIHTPLGFGIKNGQRVAPYAADDHYDHVHVAMQLGGVVQQLLTGGFVDATSTQRDVALTSARNLLTRGLNNKGASGIVGNSWRESKWDPRAEGTGGGGLYGFTAGAISLPNLKAAADRQGRDWGNIDFQNDFMWEGPEPASRLRSALNGQSSAADAAEYFDTNWERSGIKAMAERKDGAREVMRLLGEDEGSESGVAEKVPKAVTATYDTYETRNGNLIGLRHKEKVPLDLPAFGPIPKTEGAIKRELEYAEHELLPKYRAATRQTKSQAVKKKLQESLREIEKRIRDLRAALRDMRAEKARKRYKRRLQKELGKITGYEPHIEAAERAYEERDEYASQVVSQEPEQKGEITHEWLTNIFEPYVNEQETPAYGAVLGAENTWRNTILDAQAAAKGIERGWETQIGWPQDGRQPWLENPNLHYPPRSGKGPTGIAQQIYIVNDVIDNMEKFIHQHQGDSKWWDDHPDAKELRETYRRELPGRRRQLADFRFKRGSLTEVLGEGRESFDYVQGTGSFEDSMVNVQGRHWPEQHDKVEALPSLPVPGVYGGAIWATQEAIKGLGLKIEQAKESVTSPEDTRGQELKSFSDAIINLLSGETFYMLARGQGEIAPYMGAFASGGVALVGERGPELAYLPNGTHVKNATDTERILEKQGDVTVNNYFSTPPPDPHTWARQQEFELGALS